MPALQIFGEVSINGFLHQPPPPKSSLLWVKHFQFFSRSHLMSFLLLIKTELEKLGGLHREARSGGVVNSPNLGRVLEGQAKQNKQKCECSQWKGVQGPKSWQAHKPQARFCFLLSRCSTPGYSPALGPENFFHLASLVAHIRVLVSKQPVIPTTICLFKFPVLYEDQYL